MKKLLRTTMLGFMLGAGAYTSAASPPVKVALRTSWPAPPLLVEIIETISQESPTAFFPLFDALTSLSLISSESQEGLSNPQRLYNFALSMAQSKGYLTEPASIAITETNLALHAAQPLVEAFYEYYRDRFGDYEECEGSWVEFDGKVACDVRTLEKLVEASVEGKWEASANENGTVALATSPVPQPKFLPFDHIFPPTQAVLKSTPALPDTHHHTAILYATATSPTFRFFHEFLYPLSNKPEAGVRYVVRWKPPKEEEGRKSYLSGYGVALDLKKMDYLSLDDRRARAQRTVKTISDGDVDSEERSSIEDEAETDPILDLLSAYPLNTTLDLSVPLTEEELLDIGFQVTQLIHDLTDASASNTSTSTSTSTFTPLTLLKSISQSFPKYATSLARRVTISTPLEEEILSNQARMQGLSGFGGVKAWVNGAEVGEGQDEGGGGGGGLGVFQMIRTLKKERQVVGELKKLGLGAAQAVGLVTHPAIAAAQGAGGEREGKAVVEGLVDASDRLEGGVVRWWNDFERDARYRSWSPKLRGLLRPLYPGSFHNIRRNLWNVILVLDLSRTSNLQFVAGSVQSIVRRQFPFRFGVVPVLGGSEDGNKMTRLFYYLMDNYGREKTAEFFKRISGLGLPPDRVSKTVNWKQVRAAYDAAISSPTSEQEIESEAGKEPSPEHVPKTFEDVISAPSDEEGEMKVKAYLKRLGVSTGLGHAFVNGRHYTLDDDFLRNMQIEAQKQLSYLQEKIYVGVVTDESNMETYFYDLPTTSKRRNPHIHTTNKPDSLRVVNMQDLLRKAEFPAESGTYVYSSESGRTVLIMYVVADLNSEAGLELLKETLSYLSKHGPMRVSFVHNPSQAQNDGAGVQQSVASVLSHLIFDNILAKASPSRLLRVLGLDQVVTVQEGPQIVVSGEDSLEALFEQTSNVDSRTAAHREILQASRLIAQDLQLAPGEQALIINGRVIGPIRSGEFVAEDFETLAAYEMSKRVQPVIVALEEVVPQLDTYDKDALSQLIASASSIVAAIQTPDPSEVGLFNAPQRPRQRSYQLLDGEYTRFEIGNHETALFHLGLILDPLSEAAQKWTPLLEWLSAMPEVYIEVYLNPMPYGEMPIKRFYRYNLRPRLTFDENGNETPSTTVFEGLPIDPIYTLAMDVPMPWLVRPREALYDLDNLQLGSLSDEDWLKGVEAVFDLDFLVVEGHARDVFTNAPPRGLQLQLTTHNSTPIADTQVVANLGYLQFRAKPGVFQLEIRPGRGREIYRMESVGNEGWNSPAVDQVGNEITLTSFEGLTLYPRVAKNLGMERADVLAEPERDDSLINLTKELVWDTWSSIMSVVKPDSSATKAVEPVQAEINIFTVASGLLYERFLSIMVLSVLRNTQSTVKFWFIENFLSPSFLEFIPHFAEAYGFQYELVTYKWPSWLRAQKEKQRIIWAYKILFLDVLFPMDLKKVIFVDADQIVRTDLKELVDLDIHGAPYAYTPMGDDNKEMEGFRFWKQGYWRDFLRGRPYHISALYVVDLVRFRQMAAGDILRSHYQALSADPSSLANLDQDLPNNLQREVPIFSLHEDWLWCETWCSKERFDRAKTIDLCQNPLTKEPKLARARQIPEWEEYDSEIARFARKLAEEGQIRSGIAAADANALANVAAVVSAATSTSESEAEKVMSETAESGHEHTVAADAPAVASGGDEVVSEVEGESRLRDEL